MNLIKAMMERLSGKSLKTLEMSKETKGILTILIAEIQNCKDMEEIKSLLDCWIKANDLHPEAVERLSTDELIAKYFPMKT